MASVSESGERKVLRSRPFRSVTLETDEAGRLVVVKRFHHPNALLAGLDRRRARAEHRALAALHAARLPVPRPLGLGPFPGGWEVRLEPIAGARGLDELLRGEAPAGGWARLCARLGALLAELHAAGIEHGDLHPGNVLVDRDGRPWLIDFHRARRRPRTRRLLWRDLARAEAAGREALAPRLRARFLLACLRAAGGRAGLTRARLGELARAGRELRRSSVRHGLGRWLRESSRVRRVERAGRTLLVRRDLDAQDLAGILEQPARARSYAGPARELCARWLAAARLHEHGIRVLAPAVLDTGREPRAYFERPGQTCPVVPPLDAPGLERALERLRSELRDRGLALPELELEAGEPGLFLVPPRRVLELRD
jgi:hypothetical protein